MKITRSVVSERERALLSDDYSSYHAHATRRIHALRKRLGVATPRSRKYTAKAPVTAEDVAKNSEWIQLLLASSERSWASAMAMKSSQSAENTQKAMPASTKRQIASRLRRASTYAENLVLILSQQSGSEAKASDVLEAQAYSAMMKGSLSFEKGHWDRCLKHYSTVKIIYATLESANKTDLYKELLTGTVDPSIRYAAYQLKIPRTKPLQDVAVENFPTSEAATRERVLSIDPAALQASSKRSEASKAGDGAAPSSISWRTRTVKIEDSAISQALANAVEREKALSSQAGDFRNGKIDSNAFAAAYDEIIDFRQDAVDAAKTAIEELTSEGVQSSDSRIQALQITRTALSYAVIEFRIGRNRILCGKQDGVFFEPEKQRVTPKPRKDGKVREQKEEKSGRKLARLRERVALYEAILQSIDAVKELPGVIADTSFVQELDLKRCYFRSLKCLAIGRSHSVNGVSTDALALYARALDLSKKASKLDSSTTSSAPQPIKFDLAAGDIKELTTRVERLVTRNRALVELKNLQSSTRSTAQTSQDMYMQPLVEKLHMNQYNENVDLSNLVTFPPKLQPVPVKPLFFDLAWNYIDYPGRVATGEKGLANGTTSEGQNQDAPQPTKKGWFGFGR